MIPVFAIKTWLRLEIIDNLGLREKLRPPEMIVDLREEEDAVTDPAGVPPALEPGEGGVSPHLLPPSIRRVSAATVLRI